MHQECETSPIIIFSHMKWDDIHHRPHHFGVRYAKFRKTYFIEEPEYSSNPSQIFYQESVSGVTVIKISLNDKLSAEEELIQLKNLMNQFVQDEQLEDYTCLYFTPVPWSYTSHLTPETLIYDCLDQNVLGLHDPQEFDRRENELIQASQIMTTHSYYLYQDKQYLHPNLHLIQNSVDYQLFSLARKQLPEPEDQARVKLPKIGYYGKIDDRLDFGLIDELAKQRPDYQFIFLGPIETNKSKLPQRKNIHYLGKKNYHNIPSYIAHWNCSILPFHLTDEKLKINPVEIKELLAAGVPIIATNAIEQDIFAQRFNVLHVVESPKEMMNHIHKSIINDKSDWLNKVDRYLIGKSWNNSFLQLAQLERSLKHPYRTGDYPTYQDPSLTSIGIV